MYLFLISVITIPLSSKKEDGSRVYDKNIRACFVPMNTQTLPDIFFQSHKNEKEILQIKSLNSKDPVEARLREKMLGKIRLNGDFCII